jgi:hypothetical protein
MNCNEAVSFVSVLYDGEPVPVEAAEHVDACPNCRERLRSYSEMGAELRLMASRTTDPVIPIALRDRLRPAQRPPRFAFLRARVLVPRFAVALLAAGFLAASLSIVVLRAQSESRPLWFQFALDLKGSEPLRMSNVAQAGYDNGLVLWKAGDQIFGSHIVVSAVTQESVRLAIRARKYGRKDTAKFQVKEQLGDLQAHTFTYVPGAALEIPVEGGGTLVLQGKVVDHQPKIAWGLPEEPGPDQVVLTSPLVISGDALIANLEGGGTMAWDRSMAASIYTPALGHLMIALRAFSGAVQAEANWGDLKFVWQGRSYSVRAASPITGGAQPHAVWVALDLPEYASTHGNGSQIGAVRIAPEQ